MFIPLALHWIHSGKYGRWTPAEKAAFLTGLRRFGRGKWKEIAKLIPSRSTGECRTLFASFFLFIISITNSSIIPFSINAIISPSKNTCPNDHETRRRRRRRLCGSTCLRKCYHDTSTISSTFQRINQNVSKTNVSRSRSRTNFTDAAQEYTLIGGGGRWTVYIVFSTCVMCEIMSECTCVMLLSRQVAHNCYELRFWGAIWYGNKIIIYNISLKTRGIWDDGGWSSYRSDTTFENRFGNRTSCARWHTHTS